MYQTIALTKTTLTWTTTTLVLIVARDSAKLKKCMLVSWVLWKGGGGWVCIEPA